MIGKVVQGLLLCCGQDGTCALSRNKFGEMSDPPIHRFQQFEDLSQEILAQVFDGGARYVPVHRASLATVTAS